MTLVDLLVQALEKGVSVEIKVTITFKNGAVEVQTAFNEPALHQVRCDKCGWQRSYARPDSAKRGLRTHKTRHCKPTALDFSWINRSDEG